MGIVPFYSSDFDGKNASDNAILENISHQPQYVNKLWGKFMINFGINFDVYP